MKLFKLAWDMVGSEFAGRHLQYEKFYAGASFIVRNHSYRETDWAAFNKVVDDLMATYDHTGALGKLAAEYRFPQCEDLPASRRRSILKIRRSSDCTRAPASAPSSRMA